jgi:dCMP deaminase
MKDKFIVAHMKAAENYSKLSSAKRLQVGCIIVKNDTIIGIGYNGMPAGWDNECETIDYVDENGQDYDEMVDKGYTFGAISEVAGYVRRITKPEVLHAETNCISKVAKSTNSTEGADMFITHAPCLECAKLIHQSGICKVFYKHTYRSDDGLKFLRKCNIETIQIKDK